jgi:DNA polymerase alpha subunit A
VDRYVLDQILSGEATEDVVENIHEYLTKLGENVRNGSIKQDDFIIFKVRYVILFCTFIC